MKTLADKLNLITRTLPEPMQEELLDFAEFLKMKQERRGEGAVQGNLALLLHKRFKGIEVENLPFPLRRQVRTPPDL